MSARMPVVYLPHGGGPWPFVDVGLPPDELRSLAEYLRGLPGILPAPPRALLVLSAHWEAPVPTVMSAPRPPMLYDYYGFPPRSYTLQWPAPGDPTLAAHVRDLLSRAGLESDEDPSRGFDHGTFIPMMLSWPQAQVPTVQLSLQAGLDPAAHLALGRALAPLRDEGVFIIGSGLSYHNLRALQDPHADGAAQAFDTWLAQTVVAGPAERDARLADWSRAPAARLAHPREEHLLPLMVAAGAAGTDHGSLPWRGTLCGKRISAVHFAA